MAVTAYHAFDDDSDATTRVRPARPAVEDREEEHVGTLLRALRPDQVDKLKPAPPLPTAAPVVRVRDPRDGWGGTPPGIEAPDVVADDRVAAVCEVHARLRRMAPDARAVCLWLRAHAELEPGGLRALYYAVARAFASAEQTELWARDFGACRDGTHRYGRHLVLAAARAWGLRDL